MKEYTGHIIIASAIVLAAIIYALSTRFTPAAGDTLYNKNTVFSFDRWTGKKGL